MKSIIFSSFRSEQGFTLTELLVTMGIIALVSSTVFFGHQDARDHFRVESAAVRIATDIRQAQEWTTSAREVNGQVPAGGIGVTFEQEENSYTLFARQTDTDGHFGDVPGDTLLVLQSGEEMGIELVMDQPRMTVRFLPPAPRVAFFPQQNELIIGMIREEDMRSIRINAGGLIEVVSQ